MSTEEAAGAAEPIEPSAAVGAEPANESATEPVNEAEEPRAEEFVEIPHAPVEVGLQRSVRYGRILIGAAALGALIGAIASLFFPVAEGADYELGQVAGLMAVVGGAIGLALGALLSLLLGIVARRNRGAAIAVQTDVR